MHGGSARSPASSPAASLARSAGYSVSAFSHHGLTPSAAAVAPSSQTRDGRDGPPQPRQQPAARCS
eukprot:gene47025-61439_t